MSQDGSDDALVASWQELFAEPTSGWDFSGFGDRIETGEPPWSYDDLARGLLAGADSALDVGTGGGEILLGLLEALPADTVATEGWPPNLPVARAALEPHGIAVHPYDAEAEPRLPFDDDRFDVVLVRHEAYVATEVARVLTPGGRFLTQQVDGRDSAEMHALFGSEPAYSHITLPHLRAEAEDAGMAVETAQEWRGTMRFADVSTLVSYLRMVPWEVPEGFTVEAHANTLLALHHEGRPLEFTQRQFVLVCRQPA